MRRLTPVFLSLLFASCAGREAARDPGDPARGMIRVDVSYTHLTGAAASDLRFDAQAHFVRYRSFDPAGVPTLLGFADFDGIPLDACRVSDGATDLDLALGTDGTRAVPAEVALLDAGRVEIRGPIDRAPLRVAHYPELVPFVSGVVYGADENRPISLGLGQSYQVSGDGGEEVGPFSASVMAPRAFPSLSLDPLRRGADLDVRWTAAEGDAGDALLLEAKWSARGQRNLASGGAHAVRCRVRDDGEFSIPREALGVLPSAAALSSATVTAVRLARTPVTAAGAGRGEFTVELRDVAPLQVSP